MARSNRTSNKPGPDRFVTRGCGCDIRRYTSFRVSVGRQEGKEQSISNEFLLMAGEGTRRRKIGGEVGLEEKNELNPRRQGGKVEKGRVGKRLKGVCDGASERGGGSFGTLFRSTWGKKGESLD